MANKNHPRSGFTRTDLLVVLGCIFFLALVWIRPSLAGSAAASDAAICANNLRTIGGAFHQWWQENDERLAWYIPPGDPAGTRSFPWHQNLWFHFFWLSNQLDSPRYLADPADDWPHLRVATSWGSEVGGLLNPANRNNAISYLLGLHGTPLQSDAILAGDGNARGSGTTGCSSGINATAIQAQDTLWPESGHINRGNLLFSDGRVELSDTAQLKQAVTRRDAAPTVHVLKPRP